MVIHDIDETFIVRGGSSKTEKDKSIKLESLSGNVENFYVIISRIIANKDINPKYFSTKFIFPSRSIPIYPIIYLCDISATQIDIFIYFILHSNMNLPTTGDKILFDDFIEDTGGDGLVTVDKCFEKVKINKKKTTKPNKSYLSNFRSMVKNNCVNMIRCCLDEYGSQYKKYDKKGNLPDGYEYTNEMFTPLVCGIVTSFEMMKLFVSRGVDINSRSVEDISFANVIKFIPIETNVKYPRIKKSNVFDVYKNIKITDCPDKFIAEFYKYLEDNGYDFSMMDGWHSYPYITNVSVNISKGNIYSDYFILYLFKLCEKQNIFNSVNYVHRLSTFSYFIPYWERLLLPLFKNGFNVFIDLTSVSKMKYDMIFNRKYQVYNANITKTLASVYSKPEYLEKIKCTVKNCMIYWDDTIVQSFIKSPTIKNAIKVIDIFQFNTLFDYQPNQIIDKAYDKIYKACLFKYNNKNKVKYKTIPEYYWAGSQTDAFFTEMMIIKEFIDTDLLFISDIFRKNYKFFTDQNMYYSFQSYGKSILYDNKMFKIDNTFLDEKKRFLKSNKRFLYHTISIIQPEYNHANCVIIDKKRMIVEHFEPDYTDSLNYENEAYMKGLKKLYKKYYPKFKFISPNEMYKNNRLQTYSNHMNEDIIHREITGYCLLWVIWYLRLRLLNPDLEDIIGEVTKDLGQESIRKYIRSFSYKYKKKMVKFINSENITIPEYENLQLSKNTFNKISKKIKKYLKI